MVRRKRGQVMRKPDSANQDLELPVCPRLRAAATQKCSDRFPEQTSGLKHLGKKYFIPTF